MIFLKMARELILNNTNWMESTVPSVNCWENQSMEIECKDDCCKGGEGCLNKRIQKCEVKKVRKERGEKGFGLFADEDIQKGEYMIKYTGKIVYEDPNNGYTMKYKDFDLWVNASKTNTLAKLMNHSCNPNCINKMWAIKGMPRLCFFANRNILKGQELTFSYGWTLTEADLKQKGTVCLCGADSCNGTIEKGVKIS
jgi:SET domain-containing protein